MHTINLKRSAATLAAAAGLLAAATAPADAQVMPGTIGQFACTVTCLDQDLNSLKRDAHESASDLRWSLNAGGDDRAAALSLKADSNEVAVEGVKPRHSVGRDNTIEI
jgi:hypothetical protein